MNKIGIYIKEHIEQMIINFVLSAGILWVLNVTLILHRTKVNVLNTDKILNQPIIQICIFIVFFVIGLMIMELMDRDVRCYTNPKN